MKNRGFVVLIVAVLVFTGAGRGLAARLAARAERIADAERLLPDVRIQIPSDVRDILKQFVATGAIRVERFGVDVSQVKTIRLDAGKMAIDPPVRLEYDGPGFLNAGVTVSEVRITPHGDVLIDLNRSPIDIIIEGKP